MTTTMTTTSPLNGTTDSVPMESTPLLCTSQQPCVYEYTDYTQLPAVQAIFITLNITIIILAILGNTLVIWTVRRNPSLHNLTNYYIVNLAVSDIMIAVFVVPMRLMEYVAPLEWRVYDSDILCGIVQYLMPVFVFSSVLTLIAVSIERYQAVIDPFSSLHASRTCRRVAILLSIWLIPIILCTPFVYFKSYPITFQSHLGTINRQMCRDRYGEIDVWLHGPTAQTAGHFRRGYHIILFVTMYMVPLFVICYSSVRIAVHLLMFVEKVDIGRRSSWILFEENKRKVAKMVIVVVIFFFMSWTPFYLINIISLFYEDFFSSNYLFIQLLTHLIGFTNCCTNPFIYIIMCDKFNESFRRLVRNLRFYLCFGCRHRSRSSLATIAKQPSAKSTTEMSSFKSNSKNSRSIHSNNSYHLHSQSTEDGESVGEASVHVPRYVDHDDRSVTKQWLRKFSTSNPLDNHSANNNSDNTSAGQTKTRRVSIVTEKLEQEFPQNDMSGRIMLPNLKQKSVKKLLRKISVGAMQLGEPGTPNMAREELDQWKGSLHCLLDIQLADQNDSDDSSAVVNESCSVENRTNTKNCEVTIENSFKPDSNDRTCILDDVDNHVPKGDKNVSKSCGTDWRVTPAKMDTLSVSDVTVAIQDSDSSRELEFLRPNGDLLRQSSRSTSSATNSSPNNDRSLVNTVSVSTDDGFDRKTCLLRDSESPVVSLSEKADACCQTPVGPLGDTLSVENLYKMLQDLATYNGDLKLALAAWTHDRNRNNKNNENFQNCVGSSQCDEVATDEPGSNLKYDNNRNLYSPTTKTLEDARRHVMDNQSKLSWPNGSRTSGENGNLPRNGGNVDKNSRATFERPQQSLSTLKHKAYTRVSRTGLPITTNDGAGAFRLYNQASPVPSPRSKRNSSPPPSPSRISKTRSSPVLNRLPDNTNYYRRRGSPTLSWRSNDDITSRRSSEMSPNRKKTHKSRRKSPSSQLQGVRFAQQEPASPIFRRTSGNVRQPVRSGFVTDSDMELTYTLKMRNPDRLSSSSDNIPKMQPRHCKHSICKSDSNLVDSDVSNTIRKMASPAYAQRSANRTKQQMAARCGSDSFDSEGSIYKASGFICAHQQSPNMKGGDKEPNCGYSRSTNNQNSQSSYDGSNQRRRSGSKKAPPNSVDNEEYFEVSYCEPNLNHPTLKTHNAIHENKSYASDVSPRRPMNGSPALSSTGSSPKRRRSGVTALNEHNVPLKSTNPDIVYLDIITRSMQEMIPNSMISSTHENTSGRSLAVENPSFDQQPSMAAAGVRYGGMSKSASFPPTIMEESAVGGDMSDGRNGGPELKALNMCFGMVLGENVSKSDACENVTQRHEIGEIRKLSVDCKVPFLSESVPSQTHGAYSRSSSRQRKITPVLQATASKLRKLIGNNNTLNESREQLHRPYSLEDHVQI